MIYNVVYSRIYSFVLFGLLICHLSQRVPFKLILCELTSRSVPAKVAPRRLQFFSFAFFRVATRRLIPVIWLPSMSTPFRLAPAYKYIWLVCNNEPGTRPPLTNDCDGLPSRLAFSPDGSSKLHPFREAPSALEQSIFTPCRLAPFKRQHVCVGLCPIINAEYVDIDNNSVLIIWMRWA